MKRAIFYFGGNALFAYGLYLACWEQNIWAQRLVIFATWWLLISSITLQSDEVLQKVKDKLLNPILPMWVDHTFDMLIVAIMIAHGWWFTGLAYFFHFGFIQLARYDLAQQGSNA